MEMGVDQSCSPTDRISVLRADREYIPWLLSSFLGLGVVTIGIVDADSPVVRFGAVALLIVVVAILCTATIHVTWSACISGAELKFSGLLCRYPAIDLKQIRNVEIETYRTWHEPFRTLSRRQRVVIHLGATPVRLTGFWRRPSTGSLGVVAPDLAQFATEIQQRAELEAEWL